MLESVTHNYISYIYIPFWCTISLLLNSATISIISTDERSLNIRSPENVITIHSNISKQRLPKRHNAPLCRGISPGENLYLFARHITILLACNAQGSPPKARS